MLQEEWKTIPDWPNYEASTTGRLRSVKRAGRGGHTGRVLKQHVFGDYLMASLSTVATGRKRFSVHELIAMTFIGPRPPGLDVNHKDLNKLNNSSYNLEYLTPAQNTLHALRLREVPHGERVHSAKLKRSDVLAIRTSYATGEATQDSLAARFGVTQCTIGNIVRGLTWAKEPGPRTLPGERTFGENWHRTKLSTTAVQEIRDLYASHTVTQSALAQKFGVAQATIQRIVAGKLRQRG